MVDTTIEAGRLSYVKILHNNPVDCGRVYDLVVNLSGELFFTDVDRRRIGKLVNGNTVEHVAGSGRDEPRDGCQQTFSFVQPIVLCSEGDSLYVTDTGAGALKLIMPTKPMAKFMESVSALYWSHGIHSPLQSIDRCITSLEGSTTYFEKAVNEAIKNCEGGRL